MLFKEEKITKILEEKLSKTFKYFNSDSFVLVDVPGDGNCGYYTIQLFLELNQKIDLGMNIQEFRNFFLEQIKLKINELKEQRYNEPNKLKSIFEKNYLSIYDKLKNYLNGCRLESYFTNNYFILVLYLFENINEIYDFNNI